MIPNCFDDGLNTIHPDRSRAFSPALYTWMRRYLPEISGMARAHARGPFNSTISLYSVVSPARVVQIDLAANLWDYLLIGVVVSDSFIGTAVDQILVRGNNARPDLVRNCSKALQQVQNFWPNYLAVGRCALDPAHVDEQVGDRYVAGTGMRACLWCGQTQVKLNAVCDAARVDAPGEVRTVQFKERPECG